MTQVEFACVVVDDCDDEDQLQIGDRDVRRRTKERTGSAISRCHQAGARLAPFEYRACQLQRASERNANCFGVIRHAPRLNVIDMVLQVLADARQVILDWNAEIFQFFAGADAGKLQ